MHVTGGEVCKCSSCFPPKFPANKNWFGAQPLVRNCHFSSTRFHSLNQRQHRCSWIMADNDTPSSIPPEMQQQIMQQLLNSNANAQRNPDKNERVQESSSENPYSCMLTTRKLSADLMFAQRWWMLLTNSQRKCTALSVIVWFCALKWHLWWIRRCAYCVCGRVLRFVCAHWGV